MKYLFLCIAIIGLTLSCADQEALSPESVPSDSIKLRVKNMSEMDYTYVALLTPSYGVTDYGDIDAGMSSDYLAMGNALVSDLRIDLMIDELPYDLNYVAPTPEEPLVDGEYTLQLSASGHEGERITLSYVIVKD